MLGGLMDQSIHSHEGAENGTVLLIGLFAISGTGGIAGTTIPVHRGDYFLKESNEGSENRCSLGTRFLHGLALDPGWPDYTFIAVDVKGISCSEGREGLHVKPYK
jgi:hypothetical protein